MATNKNFNAEQGLSVGANSTTVIDENRNITAGTIGSGAITVSAGGITQSGGNNSFTGQSSFISADTKQILVKNNLEYTKATSGTSGQNTIVVSNNTNLTNGMLAVGGGIAPNATITLIVGTTITLSAVNTGTVSGNVVFSSPALYIGSSAEYPFILTGGGAGVTPIWSMGYDGKLGLGGAPSVSELLLVNGNMRVVNNLTVDGTLITSASLNIVANTTLGTNSGNTLTVNATPTFQTAGTLNGTTWSAGGWSNLGAVTTVDINGGTIDGATIGATSTGSARFSSVNKVVITEPASNATLTIANGKTLTANNSITLTGDDSRTFNVGSELAGSIDLNTITSPGIYYQSADADAASGTNYPIASAGVLEVTYAASNMYWQQYTVRNTVGGAESHDVYLRAYYNAAWTSWTRQANALDKLSLFSATTSSELAGVISDETGSGSLVFGTSPTLTAPRFVNDGFIADSNGNELLQFGVVASAVNQVKISNSATGNNPFILGTGETNIGLDVYSSGTGTVNIGTWGSSATNTVHRAGTFHNTNTSGVPATGIGVSIGFSVETSNSNWELGAIIEAVTTDVTSTSEAFDLVFKTMAAGASAAERLKLNNTGASIPTSHTYQINGTTVLGATTLGGDVTGSSLTSVGILSALTVTGTTTFNSSTPVTISSGVGSGEGGHLVLSYKNVAVIGQTNSTWNIDVGDTDGANALRIFRQSAAGATNTVLTANETSGLVTIPNGFQANAACAIVGALTMSGTHSTTSSLLNVGNTLTNNSNSVYGVNIDATVTGGASTTTIYGISNQITYNPSVAIGTLFHNNNNVNINSASSYTFVHGVDSQLTLGASALGGVIGSYSAFRAQAPFFNGSSTDITSYFGFATLNPLDSGSSTIGTVYGFYSNVASGTGTRWGFFGAGNANNAFAGSTIIGGTTTPATILEVVGTSSSTHMMIGGNNFNTNKGAYLTFWDAAGNTDIDGLIAGTTTGALLIGPASGHFTIALRDNDSTDGFQIVSRSPSFGSTYTKLAFEVKGDGSTTVGGSLVLTGTSALKLHVGNTAQRPTSSQGLIRFNSEFTTIEYDRGSGFGGWATLATLDITQTYTKAQRGAVVALVDGATITIVLTTSNNFSVTLAGNRTLANPTNLIAGQSGFIAVTQDEVGSRTLAFGANWKFTEGVVPTLTTAANAVDYISYYAETSSRIFASLVKDVR